MKPMTLGQCGGNRRDLFPGRPWHILFLGWVVLTLQSSSILAQNHADTINRVDDSGRKQGFWRKTDNQGRMIYQGRFVDDQPEGEFVYYDEKGRVKARSWFSEMGGRSFTRTFHGNGKTLSEGYYSGREKDSTWRYYDEEGRLAADEKYDQGIREGVSRIYHNNGKTAEEVYWKQDLEEGPFRQWYQDGTLKVELNYVQGTREGEGRFYFPSGKLSSVGVYLHSLRIGEWKFYDQQGMPLKTEFYEDGRLLREEMHQPQPDDEVEGN
ncbi:MAG: toxin-antitoxin system YwqK family antitoxin [Bacteroidales bacterium]|nr:toxin-antitoxin system YwqK family antitoxin [Bacteroidales bacterium]